MTQQQILIQRMNFNLPNGTPLLKQLSLTIAKRKTGLVGRNGMGKSTLLKLIAGEIQPNSGSIYTQGNLAYVAQIFADDVTMTIADYCGYANKIDALRRIHAGSLAELDFNILNDDWLIEKKAQNALQLFGLQYLELHRPLASLSGGELTRLMLTKAFASNADFLLLDEPTNHLDGAACEQLYHALSAWPNGLLVASHDRHLLNLMQDIIEITSLGTHFYGGNYAFYQEQRQIDRDAKIRNLGDAKKAFALTNRSIQLNKEKHEQRQAKGREGRRAGGQATILLDAMENRSTKSLGEMSTRHQHMLRQAEETLSAAKEKIEIIEEIHVTLPATYVSAGKIILQMEDVSFRYQEASVPIISQFDLTIQGAERVAITGANGCGKSTLLKLILGKLTPNAGTHNLGTSRYKFLDQTLNILNPQLSVLENFLLLNLEATEHDAHCALAAFLFKNLCAHKLVKELSGGEKLRAALACTLMSKHPPQLLLMDEPTNHLDLQSLHHIESALNCYQGAILVVSHDQTFLENINIERHIHILGGCGISQRV